MRRIPAILALTAFLIATLIACGGSDTPTPQQQSPPTTAPKDPAPTEPQPTRPPTPTTQPAANTPAGDSEPGTTIETEPPPDVVAEVNGAPIPMAEFQRQLIDARTYLLGEGLIDPDTEEGQAALSALRQRVLDQLIDQVLIKQTADEMGLTVTDEELEASISSIKEDLGSEEAYAESLAANNLAEDEFRKLQRQQLLSRKVMDEITAELPDEAEQVHARHILVETRDEAADILEQLKAGASFGDLAKEHSIDETTREDGGDLGFFPRNVVLPAFEEVAFDLEVGEISGVAETVFGYHIIEVLERETRPIPDKIKGGLRQQRITNWLELRRAQAGIKRYLEP
ncbi:MAG: Foldase protein PrsA 2 [Anaerolineales bacterium]|nr:Foldase protein PrsA 2 [Anaerolineales bacterium]